MAVSLGVKGLGGAAGDGRGRASAGVLRPELPLQMRQVSPCFRGLRLWGCLLNNCSKCQQVDQGRFKASRLRKVQGQCQDGWLPGRGCDACSTSVAGLGLRLDFEACFVVLLTEERHGGFWLLLVTLEDR